MRSIATRRRGTAVAAAALSLALVAPLSAPVASAQTLGGNVTLGATVEGQALTAAVSTALEATLALVNSVGAGVSVQVSGLPTGMTFDPATNTITGTPDVADWQAGETSRTFNIELVTTVAGVTQTTTLALEVQRDTDGDGFSDTAETQAGTNPNDAADRPGADAPTTGDSSTDGSTNPDSSNGSTTDGSTTDGSTTDGSTTDGSTTDGSTTDGSARDGSTDGSSLDGSTDGSSLDGSTDGSSLDGSTDGSSLDGSTDGSAGSLLGSALTSSGGNCLAAGVGLGLPLLALVPIALASQVAIPGMSSVLDQVAAPIQNFNATIQQQAGVFTPALAVQVEQLNAQLRSYGTDLGTVAGAVAGIGLAAIALTILANACSGQDLSSLESSLNGSGDTGSTNPLADSSLDGSSLDGSVDTGSTADTTGSAVDSQSAQ